MEEEEAPDIDIYHCPNCEKTHGKSTREYLSPRGASGSQPMALVVGAPPAQLTDFWFTLALLGSHADATIPKALPGPHLAPIVGRLAYVK